MITNDAHLILAALHHGELPADSAAVPKAVFMIEPASFRLSAESALDNRYMNLSVSVDPDLALEQYIDLLQVIREAGVRIKSFPGDPKTPDNVFPNNVFGTSAGRFIIGRMLHPNRQLESQRQDIRNYFTELGYRPVDLSGLDCVAELTGPLIIDRSRKLGLCGMSERVDQAGLKAMHQAFGLRHSLYFDLAEGEYHTNVVMAVLAGRACVVHESSIKAPKLLPLLAELYDDRIIHLSDAEKLAFAGNCIALSRNDLFMSQTAADALEQHNRALLESWGFRIHSAELSEIEKAGGSLRCMVGEIY